MISDVLDMSRLEAGRVRLQRTEVAIDSVIAAAVETVAAAAREKRIVVTQTAPRARLCADRAALERVVATLLRNAVKFTPEKGRINVRARHIRGAMNIYVEDSGIGIAPEALPRLGRPFEQWNDVLENGMKGSGLGLAISRSLVSLHGGTMRIRSKLGGGTIVLVHLPVVETVPELSLLDAALPRQPPRQIFRAAAHSSHPTTCRNIARTFLQVSASSAVSCGKSGRSTAAASRRLTGSGASESGWLGGRIVRNTCVTSE